MRTMVPILALFLPATALAQSPASRAVPAGMPAGAQQVRLCAAVDGKLRDFAGWVDAATGDTLVDGGRRFREAYPARYAADEEWYQSRGQLPLPGTGYVPYGLPRPLSSEDLRQPGLERAHTVQGVEVFATLPRHAEERQMRKTGGVWHPEMLYVPVDSGCNFQPYRSLALIGSVRG
jgi:hypothetical protein